MYTGEGDILERDDDGSVELGPLGVLDLGCVVYVECMALRTVQMTTDRRTTIRRGIQHWRLEERWRSRELQK